MADVLVDRSGGIVTVTLNRPQRKNAVTPALWKQLGGIFAEINSRPDDRVVVLTGAGEDFCSGADLGRDPSGSAHPLMAMRDVADAALALHRMSKPTIARVDGVAVGAGMNLALACDLVVATDRARFSQIFRRRGLSVDCGGSWLLPRLVGMQKAKELVLLGDMLSSADASAMGLVNRVVAPSELDEVVSSWAARLASGPALALSMSKTLLNKSFETSMDQALEAESQAQAVNLTGPDVREAFKAFAEKREPNFA